MELSEKYKHINGWGIDADPENEPTYPIKKYTGDDHNRLNYVRPPLQSETVEVLHSNERPNLTATFGTSAPPSGLSGIIRRNAFKHSENTLKHWMQLMLADRINVVEGIIDDLRQKHIPNIFSEKGYKSEWKYNRKGAIKSLVTAAIVTGVVIALMNKKSSRKLRKEFS